MRFLLTVRAAAANSGRHHTIKNVGSRATTQLSAPEVPSAVTTTQTKKWGQACSESCGCVLRLELGLDANDRVVSSHYAAKRVVMDAHRRPVPTLRHKKLQMTPCSCPNLHALAQTTCEHMQGKYLWQLQNEFEYAGVRSSASLQKAISTFQQLPQNSQSCLDLVEDAAMGVLKHYIPAPRHSQQLQERRYPLDDNDEEEEEYGQREDYYNRSLEPSGSDGTTRRAANTTTSVFGASFWPIIEAEEEAQLDIKPRWTTLEWMDHQQEALAQLHEKVNQKVHVTDWLSYVDQVQQGETA